MDPTPDAFPLRELYEHRDFVRRLARRLTADEHAADDLEQDVWTAALASRPRRLASAPAWLARVARNLAANRARGERRRGEREARAAVPHDAGAEDAERDFELQRRVVEAVHRLDEPYRATILMRYVRDLTPAEIAAATGVPVATVRTRLARGLDRLRAALDRAHGGERATWQRGLVVLLGGDLRPALVTGAGGLLTGGVVMGTIGKLAAGVAVVALGAWWLWPEAPGGAEPSAHATAAPAAAPELVAAAAPAEARDEGERVALAPERDADARAAGSAGAGGSEAPAERGWFVEGRVHGLSAAETAEARIAITGVNGYQWPQDAVAVGTPAEDGAFRIDVTALAQAASRSSSPLRAVNVRVDHPRRVRGEARVFLTDAHRAGAALEELEGPIVLHADVDLARAAAITGRVVLADGAPVADAAVLAWRLADGLPEETATDLTTTDAEGRFRLRLPHGGEHVVCAIVDGVRPATRIVSGSIGGLFDLGAPLVLETGATLEGRVLQLGRTLADAGVTVSISSNGRSPRSLGRAHLGSGESASLVWDDGRVEREDLRVRADEQGAWRAVGLRPGAYRVRASEHPGYRAHLGGKAQGEVEVVAPASGIDLAFSYAALIFELPSSLPPEAAGTLRFSRADASDFTVDLKAEHDARAWIFGVPGWAYSVEARFEGFEPWRRELVFPPPGEELTVRVLLDPAGSSASLELAVAAPPDLPVEVVALGLYAADASLSAGNPGAPLLTRTAPVVDGVARFDGLEQGRFRALVQADDELAFPDVWDASYVRTIELEVDLRPGAIARHAAGFELGGRIAILAKDESGAGLPAAIEIRDADGRALDVSLIARTAETAWGNTWQLSPLAPNETYPNLAPGEVEVRLKLAGYVPREVRATVEAGRTTPVEVVLAKE